MERFTELGRNRPRGPLTAIRASQETIRKEKTVEIVNQLLLPHQIEYEHVSSVEEAWQAIRTMKIRGAPAIASLAALGIACELLQRKGDQDLAKFVQQACLHLITSRPTAVNLREALERIEAAASTSKTVEQIIDVCISVWSDDIDRNFHIGDNGAHWLLQQLEAEGAIKAGEQINILTVCNTGALATSAYGTALGVITSLHLVGRLKHAYFAQTAPYMQGARLTSLELQTAKIPCTMIPDVAVASLLQGNAGAQIHAFIAGADRITANGDAANKISTFQISTLCKAIPQPFPPKVLICAPLTTLDLRMASGKEIVIEQRPAIEACTVSGKQWPGKDSNEAAAKEPLLTILVTPAGTNAFNPAFDVTPARLIDGIATEIGVAVTTSGSDDDFRLREFVQANAK